MSRLRDFFIAPARTAAPEAAPCFAPPVAARGRGAGVLAPAAALPVAAGLVAVELRRAEHAPAALVCLWTGAEPSAAIPVPGLPAASRLAAKLARRGLPARAAGALCLVDLPAGGPDAVALARGAAAAALGVPTVFALARRDDPWDPLLATADALHLAAGDDPLLAELAAQDLSRLGPPVRALALPEGSAARHLARLGLAGAGAGASAPGEPAALPDFAPPAGAANAPLR